MRHRTLCKNMIFYSNRLLRVCLTIILLVCLAYLIQWSIVNQKVLLLYSASGIGNNKMYSKRKVNVQRILTENFERNPFSEDPVHVAIVADMRSGSTFVSELFDNGPDSVYYFEPLAALHRHLYATTRLWNPIDIFHYANGSPRIIPKFEEDAVTDVVKQLFECQVDQVPIEVMAAPFQSKLVQYSRTKSAETLAYGQCTNGILGTKHLTILRPCRKLTKYRCPPSFKDNVTLPLCHELADSVELKMAASKLGTGHQSDAFVQRWHCFHSVKMKLAPCLELFRNNCLTKSVRAIKFIRLKMTVAEKIMLQNPKLRILLNVRDPRASIVSRRYTGLLAVLGKGSLEIEAKLTCKKLEEDIEVYTRLEKTFPDRVMILRYEDLANDFIFVAKRVFRWIGKPFPAEVEQWFIESKNITKREPFATKRIDSRSTALEWLGKLTFLEAKLLTEPCRNVLQMLNYDLI